MGHDRARPHATSTASDALGASGSNPGARQGTYFLGRYRVVDEIGIGGMASVHLARMDGPGGFQKWVAIKRIHPHLVEDDSFVHMFLDEARVAARISHPNVATVFELGKDGDTYWIAMEYLHGEPLREVMRKTEETGQPVPPEIACRLIADAAEGLHAAHELVGKSGERLELVHRDVTPHNLFVTYDGTTKVVDFGIAKFATRMASTRAGTLKGKLAYMSPEQVSGEPLDRRTDLFALGVVLWELTTGQRLFRMDSDLDTLAKVQECVVPRPSTVVRGYPLDLEKIVLKALARNKNERFKSAREFSRALQSLLMRRGLFVASDEVANYIQSLFHDRIEKREAHLRWAAEVTQTLSFDDPSEVSQGWGFRSGEPPAAVEARPGGATIRAVPKPLPAAGAPVLPPMRSPIPPPPHSAAAVHPALGTKLGLGPEGKSSRPPPPPPPKSNRPSQGRSLLTGTPLTEAPRSRPSPPEDDDTDDFDDHDDTIVTPGRPPQMEVPDAPPPRPAAGRPPSLYPHAAEPSSTAHSFDPPTHPDGDEDNDETRPLLADASLRVSAIPPAPQNPPPSAPPHITIPPPDQRTVVAELPGRRLPLWAVALLSAAVGLLVIGTSLLIWFRSQGAPQAGPEPGQPGPFGSARALFALSLSGRTSDRAPELPTDEPAAPEPIPSNPQPSAHARVSLGALPPAPTPAAATFGTLTVVCYPGCDDVQIDGVSAGPSPVPKRKVPVGSHRLTLKWSSPTAATKVVATFVTADKDAKVYESHP